jgi:hypothetical protein
MEWWQRFKSGVTMSDNVIIGILSSEKFSHSIELWPNYGIVCPSVVTCNGNIFILAEVVASNILYWDYKCQRLVIDGDPLIVKFWAAVDEQIRIKEPQAAEWRKLLEVKT